MEWLNPDSFDSLVKLVGLFTAITLLISNFSSLLSSTEGGGFSRYRKVIKIREKVALGDDMSESINNNVEKLVFQKLYKLNLNKTYRDKIFKIERLTNGSIECDDFKKAGFYINYKDDEITVLRKSWYGFKSIYNNIAGFAYFASGASLAVFSVVLVILKYYNNTEVTNLSITFLMLAFLVGVTSIANAFITLKDLHKLKITERMEELSKVHPELIKVDYGKGVKTIIETTVERLKRLFTFH